MVVLPQAIRNAFPAIGNELIVNIKDSSVLMIISITELMFQAKSIAGSTFKFTETYLGEAKPYRQHKHLPGSRWLHHAYQQLQTKR